MIEALYREEGKAEIIDGQIVRMSPTGGLPSKASLAIAASLHSHRRAHGGGHAFADNAGFLVELPARQSFSPDAAWYTGAVVDMRFLEGPPTLAVEIRSEGDYGPRAENEMAIKRSDYFAAGTLVVWDVDLLGPDVVRVYRSPAPETPTIYRRGDLAEAEPAVPGWRFPVDELFE